MIRAAHIYGGGILLAVGVSLIVPGLGIALGGALLIWLGLSWVK